VCGFTLELQDHNKAGEKNLRGPERCLDPESHAQGGRGPKSSPKGGGEGRGGGGRSQRSAVPQTPERNREAEEEIDKQEEEM